MDGGERHLLSWTQRAARAIVPPRLHSWWRAKRSLRRGEPELKILPFLVPRQRIALDVGANKGTYSYFLSKLCPQVFAYEPNPAMRTLLEGAMPENVTVLPFAVSNKPGRAELVIPRNKQGFCNNIGTLDSDRQFEGHVMRVSVETVRLDDQPLENVGFIKIDVEGHELEVLDGCEELIRRDKPVMLVEIIDWNGDRPWRESVARFTKLGYSALMMVEGQLTSVERFSGDNPTEARNVIFLPKAA